MPTTYVAQFAGSNYLAPLNSFVQSAQAKSFWPTMPAGVQQMSAIGGQIYAINAGNNNTGLLYNKAMLTKAGVKMPWDPKNWAQILQVAAEGQGRESRRVAALGGFRRRRRADECAPGQRQPHFRLLECHHVRCQDQEVGC